MSRSGVSPSAVTLTALPFTVKEVGCIALHTGAKRTAAIGGSRISGIIISAKALLDHNPAPLRTEIAAALDDNICRCGSHTRILRAVERAARLLREGAGQ